MNNEERRCPESSCNCLSEIIEKIIRLQKKSFKQCEIGCDRPFLGPDNDECFNTRPVSFYNCTTGEIWTIDGSTIFRVESLDGCCCTCRILRLEDSRYTSSNDLFTINLNCVSAIKCHRDINLNI